MTHRFLLVVQQLEQCSQLIQQETTPAGRMAIILLDNLADIFLYRRCVALLGRADDVPALTAALTPMVKLAKRQRESLLRSFPKKLEFIHSYDATHQPTCNPMLDPVSHAVLDVGHRYRNAIYHQDSHNPTFVPYLARLLFIAVGCLFANGDLGPEWGVRSERVTRDLQPISRYGVLDKDGTFWPARAAAAVMDSLNKGMEPDLAELRTVLADDLTDRADNAQYETGALPADGLVWVEFWERHGYDDDMLALAKRADWHDRMHRWDQQHDHADAVRKELHTAWQAYDRRIRELREPFVASVGPSTISAVLEVAVELRRLNSIADVVRQYRTADEKLGRLEACLSRLSDEYHHYLDMEQERYLEESRGL